ncbi:hypothetical protein HMI56_004398 [Coelomomyces lativittatus]|nr:hypothetical protein HMI56_004398 [Coelomomyces lativittatus]
MVFSTNATQNKDIISDNLKDLEIQSPPQDGVSDIHWSPVADYMAASSWDNNVRKNCCSLSHPHRLFVLSSTLFDFS